MAVWPLGRIRDFRGHAERPGARRHWARRRHRRTPTGSARGDANASALAGRVEARCVPCRAAGATAPRDRPANGGWATRRVRHVTRGRSDPGVHRARRPAGRPAQAREAHAAPGRDRAAPVAGSPDSAAQPGWGGRVRSAQPGWGGEGAVGAPEPSLASAPPRSNWKPDRGGSSSAGTGAGAGSGSVPVTVSQLMRGLPRVPSFT